MSRRARPTDGLTLAASARPAGYGEFTMAQAQADTTAASPRRGALRGALGWGSALAVATIAVMGAMGTVPAAAQEYRTNDARIDTGGEAATSRTLVLPLGKAAVVDLPRAASDILVSDPNIVSAVIRTPRRVYVMGMSPGQANAFFFDSRDNQILNLEIRVEQDAKVIEDVILKLVPTARIDVETVGDSVVLHGAADSPADAQRAVEIAERFVAQSGGGGGEGEGAGPVMNMIKVRQPAQVMLKVRVLEMQRRLTRQLGVNLDGVARIDDAVVNIATGQNAGFGAAAGGGTVAGSTGGIGDVNPLDLALDAFERNGLVKTLAEPSLIALSGQEADFLAGGRIYIPVAQATGQGTVITAEEINFGVELMFQPFVRSKGAIEVRLGTSVSDVNAALGTNGFPGFSVRAATTTVTLPSGTSFAIAGLLQKDIQQTVDGVPALKETPILGQLFRSQSFESDETELVIIATPYLVEPTTLAELTDPAEGHAPPTLVQSAMLGRMESTYGVRSDGVGEARLQGPLGFILD